MLLGLVDILTKRAAEGIAECEHALALDRNLAHAHSIIGFGKIFIGRAEETEAHIAEALRLSPRDTTGLHLDDISRAWRSSTSAVTSKRSRGFDGRSRPTEIFRHAYFHLAAALAQLGRLDEAHSAVKAGLALNPTYTISRVRAAWTAMSDDPTYLGRGRAHFRRHAQGRSARAMTAARRLAAILAADVVGYSRLMGEDEADTARAVREGREAAQPIVTNLGGRIVKTTGDGVFLRCRRR